MGEFESQIIHSNLEENFCLKACVHLTRESIDATPDSLLSLALLRDEQMLSLGELLMVDNYYFKPSIKHE
jgi:hypothetical protein